MSSLCKGIRYSDSGTGVSPKRKPWKTAGLAVVKFTAQRGMHCEPFTTMSPCTVPMPPFSSAVLPCTTLLTFRDENPAASHLVSCWTSQGSTVQLAGSWATEVRGGWSHW